jgi:hypothetical protein
MILLTGCAAGLAPGIFSSEVRHSAESKSELPNEQARADAIVTRLLRSYLPAEQLRQFAGRHHCRLGDMSAASHRPAPAAMDCPGFIEMVDQASINASTNGDTLRISEGLVKVASDDELAFALGHELGHMLRGHTYALLRDRYELEMEADQIGLAMAVAAGYRPEAAIDLLHRIREEQGHPFVSSTHPSEMAREQAILAALEQSALPPR